MMQTVGGERRGEAGGSKLTSFAPSLVYHSCPLAVIPNGGVSGCVRLEGAMGYGNPPVPESCPSMNCDTLSSQPLCSGKPPGSVLSPLLINVHIYCNIKISFYSVWSMVSTPFWSHCLCPWLSLQCIICPICHSILLSLIGLSHRVEHPLVVSTLALC